jgi:PiT family inorganic phosphate transporter
VKLQKYQGFSADLAAAISLLTASLFGPSRQHHHTKTTAIMGVGAAKRLSSSIGIVGEMAWAGC